MDVTVRPAEQGDVPALTALEKDCFSMPWKEDSFSFAIANPELFYLPVLLLDGEIVGYAVMQCLFEEGELQNIAVHEDYRGEGYGKMLLLDCLDTACAQNAERVFLEVREGNTVARSLYESVGFEEYGTRKNYYREPTENAILMVRLFPREY